MSAILLLLGILLTAAGAAAVGFGVWINELNRSATLILAGTSGFVGGLLLLGLAAVVAELARVAASLRTVRPVAARPARAVLEVPPPEAAARETLPPVQLQPAPSAALEVSASAIERLRSSIPRSDKPVPEAEEVPLSPNGQQQPQPAEPRIEPVQRPAGTTGAEPREPRLDFLLRPRPARAAPQQPESFDAVWPRRSGRDAQSDSRQGVPPEPGADPAPPPRPLVSTREPPAPPVEVRVPPPPAPPEEPPQERAVAILKSGVVDGMAYTLYADGSIEAQLPQGTVRFGSIAELRAHIESNS